MKDRDVNIIRDFNIKRPFTAQDAANAVNWSKIPSYYGEQIIDAAINGDTEVILDNSLMTRDVTNAFRALGYHVYSFRLKETDDVKYNISW